MIRVYLGIAIVSIALGLGSYVWYLQNKVESLEARETELVFAVESCDNRIQNILEDFSSDAEINKTPDNDLGDLVRPDWLRE